MNTEPTKKNRKEYRKEYYEKNKETELSKQREYYKENKEKISGRKKEYSSNNKGSLKEYHKEYYERNKEAILEKQKTLRSTVEAKEIKSKYGKLWREKNKETIAKRKHDWYVDEDNKIIRKEYLEKNKENFKEKRKVYTKVRKFKSYNITEEQYDEMFNNQSGCCRICGIPQEELKTPLHIDHNHNTGKVRGLLCHNCNRGIGHFHDSIDKLECAINYLKINDLICN